MVVGGGGEDQHGFGGAGEVELVALGGDAAAIHFRQQPRGEFHVFAAGARAAGIVFVAAIFLFDIHKLAIEQQAAARCRGGLGVAGPGEARFEIQRAGLVGGDPHHHDVVRRGDEHLTGECGGTLAESGAGQAIGELQLAAVGGGRFSGAEIQPQIAERFVGPE